MGEVVGRGNQSISDLVVSADDIQNVAGTPTNPAASAKNLAPFGQSSFAQVERLSAPDAHRQTERIEHTGLPSIAFIHLLGSNVFMDRLLAGITSRSQTMALPLKVMGANFSNETMLRLLVEAGTIIDARLMLS